MVRSPCNNEKATLGLKKGPWSPEEDQKLLAYIEQHGHGSWRSLPAKAGLQRCGKSCRLRWSNYLRPDIKRGKFTLQEEQTIIQLHALLGNRWSAIAAHVPMRTDNEIKNYWNTHLKKRLTKMGIDPMTHKPNTNPFGSSHPKEAANLSHMAQWETARLEAEARLVRESKFLSNAYSAHHHMTNKPRNAPAPAVPPCLDVLKTWQQTWTMTSSRNNNNNNNNNNNIRVSNSDQNLFTFPTPLIENTSLGGTENNPLKDVIIIGEEKKEASLLYESTRDDDDVIMESFIQGFTELLPENINGEQFEDNDNKNYWNNILNNLVMSPAGSPPVFLIP